MVALLILLCVGGVLAADHRGGEECWSAFECMDDGGEACDGCGGKNWRCCSATSQYGSDHPCSKTKVEYFSPSSGHKCARSFEEDEHPGGECWSAFGCTDDGDTPCTGCGGSDWYCCSAQIAARSRDQNCKHVTFVNDLPGHRCAKMNSEWSEKLIKDVQMKQDLEAAAAVVRAAEMKAAIEADASSPEEAVAEQARVDELIRQGQERRARRDAEKTQKDAQAAAEEAAGRGEAQQREANNAAQQAKDQAAQKAAAAAQQAINKAAVEAQQAAAYAATAQERAEAADKVQQAVEQHPPAPVVKEAPLRDRKRIMQEGEGDAPRKAAQVEGDDVNEDAAKMAMIAAAAAEAHTMNKLEERQAASDAADEKQREIHAQMLAKEAAAREEEARAAKAFEESDYKAKQEEKAAAEIAALAAEAKEVSDAAEEKAKKIRQQTAKKRAEDMQVRAARKEKQKKEEVRTQQRKDNAKVELEKREEEDRLRIIERQDRRDARIAEQKLKDRASINNLSLGIAFAIVSIVCLWLVIVWKYRAGAKKLM